MADSDLSYDSEQIATGTWTLTANAFVNKGSVGSDSAEFTVVNSEADAAVTVSGGSEAYDADKAVVAEQDVAVTDEKRKYGSMGVVEEFKNGGSLVYDGDYADGDKGDMTDTMTVQVYDQYGDAWDYTHGEYSCGGLYGNNLGAWMDQGTGEKNPYDYGSIVSGGDWTKFCSFKGSDDKDMAAAGQLEITIDTTALAPGWHDAWGDDPFIFEYHCGNYGGGDDASADRTGDTWDSENVYVTVTVTDVTDAEKTYEIFVDMGQDSYDLTRAYAKDETTGEYAWGLTDEATSKALSNEDSSFTGIATADLALTVKKGGYDVGTSDFSDVDEVRITLAGGKDTYSCTAKYDSDWTCTNGDDVDDGDIGYISLETDSETGATTLFIVLYVDLANLKLNK